MTMRFTESYDVFGANDGFTYGKWFNATTTNGINSATSARNLVTGRFGRGSGLRMAGSGGTSASSSNVSNTYQLPVAATTLFLGVAVRDNIGSVSNGARPLIQFQDHLGVSQIDFRLTSGRALVITRNGTVLATSTAVLPVGVWIYFEFGAFVSDTAGWAELRMNTVPVISYYGAGTNRANATGDTKAGSLNEYQLIFHGQSVGSPETFDYSFDDLYMCDDQGAVNNNFLGDVDVVGQLPTGAGTLNDFTRVGGSAGGNYTAVNENPINADTSYVTSAAVGATDTYTFVALPDNAFTVYSVTFQPIARKDAAGNRTIVSHIHTGTALDYDIPSSDQVLSASYVLKPTIAETNPNGGTPWLISDIPGNEFGIAVSS